MAATFHVNLLTPERRVFETEALHLYARGALGYLGILAHHAPLLTSLEPGVLSVRLPDSSQRHFVVTGGFLEVSNNRATVLADACEAADEIDAARAEAALRRAREQLALPKASAEHALEFERASAAAERAAARLAVAREHASSA
jgi:F-type H+-transporting ATPase subunit epsilon